MTAEVQRLQNQVNRLMSRIQVLEKQIGRTAIDPKESRAGHSPGTKQKSSWVTKRNEVSAFDGKGNSTSVVFHNSITSRDNTGPGYQGLRIGKWAGDSADQYSGIFYEGHTSNEYCLLTRGDNTFISASSGSSIYLRPNANETTNQAVLSSSSFTVAAQPRFELRHSASVTLTDETITTIPWNTEVADVGGFHTGTNAYVTVPVDGIYIFQFCTSINAVTDQNYTLEALFGLNTASPGHGGDNRFGGNSVTQSDRTGTTNEFPQSVGATAVIYCSANDTVYPLVYQNNESGDASFSTIASRDDLTMFCGALIL